jgi:hypothetical protein
MTVGTAMAFERARGPRVGCGDRGDDVMTGTASSCTAGCLCVKQLVQWLHTVAEHKT